MLCEFSSIDLLTKYFFKYMFMFTGIIFGCGDISYEQSNNFYLTENRIVYLMHKNEKKKISVQSQIRKRPIKP